MRRVAAFVIATQEDILKAWPIKENALLVLAAKWVKVELFCMSVKMNSDSHATVIHFQHTPFERQALNYRTIYLRTMLFKKERECSAKYSNGTNLGGLIEVDEA